MRAEGVDLRIRCRGSSENSPLLITVKSFHVDASLIGLMRKHVDHVLLTGLDIQIPPKAERRQQKAIRAQQEQQEQGKGQRAEGTSGQTPEEKKNDPLKSGGGRL